MRYRPVTEGERWRRRAWTLAGLLGISLLVTVTTICRWQEATLVATLAQARALASEDRNVALLVAAQGSLLSESWHLDDGWQVRDSLMTLLQPEPLTRAHVPPLSHWVVQRGPSIGQLAVTERSGILWLAAGRIDGSVALWDLTTRPAPTTRVVGQGGPPIRSLAFDPTGEILAAGDERGQIHLRDAERLELLDTIQGLDGPVTELAFHPAGDLLAAGGDDGTLRMWTLGTGSHVDLASDGTPIVGVVFQPDGHVLLSANMRGRVRRWELNLPRSGSPAVNPVATMQAADGMRGWAMSPDGRALFWARSSELYEGDLKRGTGRLVAPPGDLHGIRTVAVSPDGRLIATGGEIDTGGRLVSSVVLWDRFARRAVGRPLMGDRGDITGLVFSPDGTLVISGATNGGILRWDVALPALRQRACDQAQRNLSADEWSQAFGALGYRCTCPGFPAGAGVHSRPAGCATP